MGNPVLVLLFEALFMYVVVLGAHSLRHRYGPAHFYALLGGITAIMSWVTDAGLAVTFGGITFVVGSTVFYTALLLGVFVVYVFDGPGAARVAITTVMAISALMPITAAVLHQQAGMLTELPMVAIPEPDLRINTASVLTTFLDLLFLAIAWEFLGKPGLRMGLWLRTYLTLLGVMWLDVFLFSTGAFGGTPEHLSIMGGTLVSRFLISLLAMPFLYGYLRWQQSKDDVTIIHRPVLAILHRVYEMEVELSNAQREIEQRKQAERERDLVVEELQESREDYRQLSERLREVSVTDELTGVPNRRLFNETLAKEWRRAARGETSLSLLILDVDGFKSYNDRHGHLEGDKCLRKLAQILSESFRRPGDFFARFGGDEFAAILPHTPQSGALKVAQNCLDRIRTAQPCAGGRQGDAALTVSIGAATAQPDPDTDPETLLRRADRALYAIKNSGSAQAYRGQGD